LSCRLVRTAGVRVRAAETEAVGLPIPRAEPAAADPAAGWGRRRRRGCGANPQADHRQHQAGKQKQCQDSREDPRLGLRGHGNRRGGEGGTVVTQAVSSPPSSTASRACWACRRFSA
jgi:hypothetical protein